MIYYPYRSDKPNKKFYIFNKSGKKIYIGDSHYEHYTQGHLDEKRKNNYIKRHSRLKILIIQTPPGFGLSVFCGYIKHIIEHIQK